MLCACEEGELANMKTEKPESYTLYGTEVEAWFLGERVPLTEALSACV